MFSKETILLGNGCRRRNGVLPVNTVLLGKRCKKEANKKKRDNYFFASYEYVVVCVMVEHTIFFLQLKSEKEGSNSKCKYMLQLTKLAPSIRLVECKNFALFN